MNINRYNYEEFFLLYVDNELTKEERAELETFVQENPDLEEELVMLKQSSIKPDMNIKFAGKSSLMKPEAAGLVNESNYEEFFLLYTDNELETTVRREVEQFASSNPQYQLELNLLLQTKIQPETTVTFPDKSLLYKEEEDRKPVVIMWWRVVAVAAMLLLALGIFWLSNRTATPDIDVAGVNNTKKDQPAVTKQPTQTINKEEKQHEQLATRDEQVNKNEQTGKDRTNKKEDIAIKKNDTEVENLAVIQQPIQVPVEETTLPLEAANVAGVYNTKNISTGGVISASRNNTVKVVTAAYILPAEKVEDDNFYIANTAVDKSKLRGIFRRVTRVFEKTTNLPAVEER